MSFLHKEIIKILLTAIGVLFFNKMYSEPLASGIYAFKAKGTNKIIQYDLQKGVFLVSENQTKHPYQQRFELEPTDYGYYLMGCFAGKQSSIDYYLKTNNNKFKFKYQESLDNVSHFNDDDKGENYEFRIIEVDGGYVILNKARFSEYLSFNIDDGQLRMKTHREIENHRFGDNPDYSDGEYTLWEPILIEKYQDVYVEVKLTIKNLTFEDGNHNKDCTRLQGSVLFPLKKGVGYQKNNRDATIPKVNGNNALIYFPGIKNSDYDFRDLSDNNYLLSSRYYIKKEDIDNRIIYVDIGGRIRGCHKSWDLGAYKCNLRYGIGFIMSSSWTKYTVERGLCNHLYLKKTRSGNNLVEGMPTWTNKPNFALYNSSFGHLISGMMEVESSYVDFLDSTISRRQYLEERNTYTKGRE